MNHKLVSGVLLLLGVALAFGVFARRAQRTRPVAQSAATRFALRPCHVPGIDDEVRCGKYEVYENRTTQSGRRIGLNIVLLPALSATPAHDPVFWLHGGPGAAATQTVSAAKAGFLANLRPNRDLVFVDQRGTGESNPLTCDLGDDPANLQQYFGELFPVDKVRQCREKLEKVANLSLYTTPIAMDDLDEVRAALGYDRINVVAGSYGTIAALVYMRQHQDHLRSVFMAGVANTDVKQPLPFAAGAQHAMDLLYTDCAADKECSVAFPNLEREFKTVLARFDQGPVTATLVDLASKQEQSISITRSNFVERLRFLLYTATYASFVPLIVHKAFENDYLPFEALAVRFNLGSILARGMYMTVTCSEGVPFITEADIIKQTSHTFVGDRRVRVHIAACKEWPHGDVPRSFIDPVQSSTPVLMMSGDLDGSTPPWMGEKALKTLPNGVQVSIRYLGHQVDSPCIWNILADFVAKGSAKELDTSCTKEIRRPPFVKELPSQFALR
jgi:pimeloyl-ACP methyl ester carboxylesterase